MKLNIKNVEKFLEGIDIEGNSFIKFFFGFFLIFGSLYFILIGINGQGQQKTSYYSSSFINKEKSISYNTTGGKNILRSYIKEDRKEITVVEIISSNLKYNLILIPNNYYYNYDNYKICDENINNCIDIPKKLQKFHIFRNKISSRDNNILNINLTERDGIFLNNKISINYFNKKNNKIMTNIINFEKGNVFKSESKNQKLLKSIFN